MVTDRRIPGNIHEYTIKELLPNRTYVLEIQVIGRWREQRLRSERVKLTIRTLALQEGMENSNTRFKYTAVTHCRTVFRLKIYSSEHFLGSRDGTVVRALASHHCAPPPPPPPQIVLLLMIHCWRYTRYESLLGMLWSWEISKSYDSSVNSGSCTF